MPVMTDVTESAYHADDKMLSAEVAKPEENPWISEHVQDLGMSVLPDTSRAFDDMPPLETLESTQTLHYNSPLPISFMEGDQSTGMQHQDVIDPGAKPGVSGLRNLGNTCFMNAGLQCLLSNPRLVKFFLEQYKLEPETKGTLTGKFADLVNKIWSGQYTQIYPSEFKEVLGSYYPQFMDYRQHDCQEFLALLLDSLHEQLNTSISIRNKLLPVEDREAECSYASSLPEHSLVEDNQTDAHSELCNVQSAPVAVNSRHSVASSPVESEIIPQTDNTQELVDKAGEVDQVSSQSHCLSEDSNQSEVSLDIHYGDDLNRRMNLIPEHIKCQTQRAAQSAVESEKMDVDSSRILESVQEHSHVTDPDSVSQAEIRENSHDFKLNNPAKCIPSIEDFYMKDTKTLNTNVLANEFMEETVSTDSEKFHKPDNLNRPTDPYETLTDFLMSEVKGPPAKAFKETNLLANMKDKFSEDIYSKKCLFLQLDEEEQDEEKYNINNIKRMKIDEEEKNIRMQARMKVNTNKNATKEDDCQPVDPCCSFTELQPGNSKVTIAGSDAVPYHQDNRNLLAAERAWKKYLEKNQSVIVDTFHGQFKSTVVCSECLLVSVTYEPFMYLSVPLPHAMERQICVTFVPCDSKQPINYLVTLNKQDNVKKLKFHLKQLVGEESADIVIAEVLDNHIARILDDNTLLRYINDTNRSMYAFEMMPPPHIDDGDDIVMATDDIAKAKPNNETSATEVNNSTLKDGGDIFSTIGVFSAENFGNSSSTMLENMQNNQKINSSAENKDLELSQILNNLGDNSTSHGWLEGSGFNSSVDWQKNMLNSMPVSESVDTGTSLWVSQNDDMITQVGDVDNSAWDKYSDSGDVNRSDATRDTGVGTAGVSPLLGESMNDGPAPVTDLWRSCAICLEEMADTDLVTHRSCGGTLCQSCLDMSFKHYGESALICPVCSTQVDPAEDFIQLSTISDYKPKTRILSVPIVQRYEYEENGEVKMKLFGHPNILYLPSQLSGDFLYETVDRVVPILAPYSILLTDGQGYHCSRCMYTTHCRGCELVRESEIILQPGDHLAVQFTDVTQENLKASEKYVEHKSMENFRPAEPLTLLDCFDAFTDSELLDEHNPWYCPRCKKNQCARKTITVWQYPETLVVYLKRFVFHELSSTKIDNKVVFPLENLDLSDYISGPPKENLRYDLQSCVCHFGGVNAGHYTSYVKHSLTSEWYYHNDETSIKQQPQENDYNNAYIFFYRRKGKEVTLSLPPNSEMASAKCGSTSCPSTSTAQASAAEKKSSGQEGPLNNEAICQLLQELQEGSQVPSSSNIQQDADSALDFYS